MSWLKMIRPSQMDNVAITIQVLSPPHKIYHIYEVFKALCLVSTIFNTANIRGGKGLDHQFRDNIL